MPDDNGRRGGDEDSGVYVKMEDGSLQPIENTDPRVLAEKVAPDQGSRTKQPKPEYAQVAPWVKWAIPLISAALSSIAAMGVTVSFGPSQAEKDADASHVHLTKDDIESINERMEDVLANQADVLARIKEEAASLDALEVRISALEKQNLETSTTLRIHMELSKQ